MSDYAIDLGTHWGTWNPKQLEYFKWEPQGGLSIQALLGAWGMGKTKGVARKFVLECLRNKKTEAYGEAQPLAALCAPTNKVLHEASLPKLYEALPKELIAKKRVAPPYIELVNGLKILLVSAEATMEGIDLAVMWIDEISHPVFGSNPNLYLNYLARLRDKKAQRRTMMVSGLPLAGWVRENFDFPPDDVDRICIRGGMDDNYDVVTGEEFIPNDVKEQLMEACPAGQEGMIVRGEWGQPPGATFANFDASVHLTRKRGDKQRPVHLGIDIGEHGGILVGQVVPMDKFGITGKDGTQDGLLIVDQVLTEYESLEDAVTRFKVETPWELIPGKSTIAVDPTIRRDEEAVLRKNFKGVTIRKRNRGDDFYNVNNGIRHIQSCLKDALGNVRIQICDNLARTKFGVVEGLQMTRTNPRTGVRIKDDSRDHVIDALRYLACELLQPRRQAPRFVG